MKKFNKIAIMDYDHTLSKGVISIELLKQMEKDGKISKGYSSEIENIKKKNIGYNNIAREIHETHAKYLKGIKEIDFIRYIENFDIRQYLNIWSLELIKLLKENNYFTVIVTAGIQQLFQKIQEELDIDTVFATRMEIKNGKFQGKIIDHINNNRKLEITRKIVKDADFTLAIGDSEGDIEMLSYVNRGYLYEPNELLKKKLKNENLVLVDENNILQTIKRDITGSI